LGHLFRPPGFGIITIHTGITGITEVVVKSEYDASTSQDTDQMRHRLIVMGKHISCPPQYAPPNNDEDIPHHDYEHDFPLIRSLRASTQRSKSVLFSFVLSLLIVAASFAIRQSKTILARS